MRGIEFQANSVMRLSGRFSATYEANLHLVRLKEANTKLRF